MSHSGTPVAHIDLQSLASPAKQFKSPRYPVDCNSTALGPGVSINSDLVPLPKTRTPVAHISLASAFATADELLKRAGVTSPLPKSPGSPHAKKTFPGRTNISQGMSNVLHESPQPLVLKATKEPELAQLSLRETSAPTGVHPMVTESMRIVQVQQANDQQHRERAVLKSLADHFYGRHLPLQRAFSKLDSHRTGTLSPAQIKQGFDEAGFRLNDYELSVIARHHAAGNQVDHDSISQWLQDSEKARDQLSRVQIVQDSDFIGGQTRVLSPTKALAAAHAAMNSNGNISAIARAATRTLEHVPEAFTTTTWTPPDVASPVQNQRKANAEPEFNQRTALAVAAAGLDALSKRVKSGSTWKLFRELDANGSGNLTLTELREGLARTGFVMDDRSFDVMSKYLDTNGDGVIQYREFVDKLNPKDNYNGMSAEELKKYADRNAMLPEHLRPSIVAGHVQTEDPLDDVPDDHSTQRNISSEIGTLLRSPFLANGSGFVPAPPSERRRAAAYRLASEGVKGALESPSVSEPSTPKSGAPSEPRILAFESPEAVPRPVRSHATYGAHHHVNSEHAKAALNGYDDHQESPHSQKKRIVPHFQTTQLTSHAIHNNSSPHSFQSKAAAAPFATTPSKSSTPTNGRRFSGAAMPSTSSASAAASVFAPGGSISGTQTPSTPQGRTEPQLCSASLSAQLATVERAWRPSSAAEVRAAQSARRDQEAPSELRMNFGARAM